MTERLLPTSRIDLHVHSHFSDGQDSPTELLKAPVAVLSICDHDTVGAYHDLPQESGPRLLPGVEISAKLSGDREIHILGYFPSGFPEEFQNWVGERESDRRTRMRAGVVALRNDGIPLHWKDYEAEVGEAVPCRSHVARCLVRIGWPRNPERLYGGFMNRSRFRPTEVSTAEVIDTIRRSGGISCWAHPESEHVRKFGLRLLREGLQGMETRSPVMRGERRVVAKEFAAEHRLLESGGTDYHGGKKKRVGWYRVTIADVATELLPKK